MPPPQFLGEHTISLTHCSPCWFICFNSQEKTLSQSWHTVVRDISQRQTLLERLQLPASDVMVELTVHNPEQHRLAVCLVQGDESLNEYSPLSPCGGDKHMLVDLKQHGKQLRGFFQISPKRKTLKLVVENRNLLADAHLGFDLSIRSMSFEEMTRLRASQVAFGLYLIVNATAEVVDLIPAPVVDALSNLPIRDLLSEVRLCWGQAGRSKACLAGRWKKMFDTPFYISWISYTSTEDRYELAQKVASSVLHEITDLYELGHSVVLGIMFTNVLLFFVYTDSSKYGSDPRAWSWLRVFTSTFAHAGLGHLLNNMMALLATGANVHDNLDCNSWTFLLLYAVASVTANLCSWTSRRLMYSVCHTVIFPLAPLELSAVSRQLCTCLRGTKWLSTLCSHI